MPAEAAAAWADGQLAAVAWLELVRQLQACADHVNRTGGIYYRGAFIPWREHSCCFVTGPVWFHDLAGCMQLVCRAGNLFAVLPPHIAGSSRHEGPPGFLLLSAAASLDLPGALLALAPVAPEAIAWTDMNGRQLSHIAAQQGSAAALEALLTGGYASPTDTTRGGDTLLHVAAGGQTAGHLAAMRLLLQAPPELALARGDGGYLPLHLAAEGGSPEAVALLLDACPLAASWAAEQDGRLPVSLPRCSRVEARCKHASVQRDFGTWRMRMPLPDPYQMPVQSLPATLRLPPLCSCTWPHCAAMLRWWSCSWRLLLRLLCCLTTTLGPTGEMGILLG